MPLRTPEKKSPLSGEGRLSSSAAESDGVENFDSKLAVGRRVSLSAMITHAGGNLRGVHGRHSKTSPAVSLHISASEVEERRTLTTGRASSDESNRAISPQDLPAA
jgi:hypothetical protein